MTTPATITLTSGDLEISKDVTITGPGADLLTVERSTASGTPQFRIFTILSGTVTISGLTVTNGHAPDGGAFFAESGGGINNSGTLTLNRVAVSGNVSGSGISRSLGNGGNGGSGGGISSTGTLTITDSTISTNSAGSGGNDAGGKGGHGGGGKGSGGHGGSGGSGGGISSTGTLTITDSTISTNSAGSGGNGADFGDGGNGGSGGGIFSGGPLTVTNSTIAFNGAPAGGRGGFEGSAGGAGGGIDASGTTSIRASIIADNSSVGSGPDVNGTVISAGFNVIGKTDGSTGFTQMSDQTGTIAMPLDPKLELDGLNNPLLKDNGGPTKTIALLPGSPAIDHGDDSVLTDTVGFPPSGLKTDQRGPGFPRKVCGHVDAGAYEFLSGVAPTVTCSDINVNNDPGKCSASVPFSVSATDACGNSLTPTCQIINSQTGNTMIMSPHTFPVGMTTVTCSATDSFGLTGTCSFTVTVNDTNVPLVSCPANIAASSDPGKSTARVSFGASATDVCDGSLTPVYKIGTMVITSPYDFPPGVTTVTASATNSHGLTGMCSFTVTVTLLDICIQDNSSGDTFRFSSQTGAYLYTRCRDKFTLTGTGMVRVVNGIASLTDSKPDRRISASFLLGQLTGRANITLIPAPGVYQTIVVNDTNPYATCTCP